jgi:hypothetical protein
LRCFGDIQPYRLHRAPSRPRFCAVLLGFRPRNAFIELPFPAEKIHVAIVIDIGGEQGFPVKAMRG